MTLIENKELFGRRLSEIDSLIEREKRFPDQIFTNKVSGFSFIRFDDIFTPEFFEKIKSFLISTGDMRFTLAVLEPNPQEYFFNNFKKYPVMDASATSTAKEYLRGIEEDPGNSPADALIYNSNILVFYGESLNWAIYADRDFELGVFGCTEENLMPLFASSLGKNSVFDSIDEINNVLALVYSNRNEGVPEQVVRQITQNYGR